MNTLSDVEFGRFQRFIYDAAGITLTPAKKALVCGRLSKRLQANRLESEFRCSGGARREISQTQSPSLLRRLPHG